MDKPPLSDEEAEALLKVLSRHYGQPVMPVSRYCEALQTWGHAIGHRARRRTDALFPGLESADKTLRQAATTAYGQALQGKPPSEVASHRDFLAWKRGVELSESVRDVFLQIRKSNLLARLLYGGEKLRTEMCPEHKGVWSGLEGLRNRCPHGCQLTGWIPEPPATPAEEGEGVWVCDLGEKPSEKDGK